MEVVFETIFPLPFYPQLDVLYTGLRLKYYQGKKSCFYLHIFIFQLREECNGEQKQTNKKRTKQQPDS